MEKQPDFADQVRRMTERVRGLTALQGQFVESMRQLQEVVLFGDHPELTSLDDELDILYRGQL